MSLISAGSISLDSTFNSPKKEGCNYTGTVVFALEFIFFTNLSLQVGVLPAYILELPLRILQNQWALIKMSFTILVIVIQYKFHVPILLCFEFQDWER